MHPLNVFGSILVMLDGISIFFIDEQLSKADSPIICTEEGILISERFEHPLNAFDSINFNVGGKLIDFNEQHLLKDDSQIDIKVVEFIFTLFNEIQLLKV